MQDSALVIASPWPRCGSSNIFAAQCRYLDTRGYRTALLLGPHLPIHRARYHGYWDWMLEQMRFEGVALVCHASTSHRMRAWRSRSHLQWLASGRDSQLSVMARYGGAATLPATLLDFIEAHPPRVIVVNHCFQMGLAHTVLREMARRRLPRPLVVLETHDVQAELYADGGLANVFRGRPDARALLERDELRLAAGADAFTHVTDDDRAYFSTRLPGPHHLVRATLTPENERRLLALEPADRERFDFAYVGDNNPGNEVSLAWFLTEVAPRLDRGCRIAIAGRIGGHMEAVRPDLFGRYAHWFVGVVDDVTTVYAQAAVVVIPTRFGTGISIKTIEALAAGNPIVATGAALRGLVGASTPASIASAEDPDGFARAMMETLGRWRALRGLSRDAYRERLSNAAYFARWDAVLQSGGVPVRDRTAPPVAGLATIGA
ncbi:glycosyltransferase [Rhodoplanes sp. TEM]|uniref:Glycosyltransferase n=1 Tax=Rhodoplanes tepidamans TaxID=200616 RepID=A0ABT5JB41_RHOTP|nr:MULTISPECIES: glycosyltransferase [Rhodoplanes]MDC7786854.1 glycosyltransferase [Rhodoplanes tepidamans]MDC7984217.1 glycosyltransferase [Rhodoplanes sp. TEM]MDQ0355982.1 glycosyltransferase involved in cell wall biosynthesis [Rhodoplanes tepidamans]